MPTLWTKTIAWHHLRQPKPAELRELGERLGLHELVRAELTRPTMRPKVDAYDDHLYLVLHFPLFESVTRKTHSAEVDFILTRNALITVTYEPIPPLDDLFKKFSRDESSRELRSAKTPAHLLFSIGKELYAFALRELDHIQENINRIEERVVAGRESDVIEELAVIRRDVIDFRRAIKPQQSTLESLTVQAAAFYGPAVRPFLEGLVGEYLKVWNLLENNKEAIDALYDSNAAVLSIKQNEAMKIVAIMAFITFPLMLFTALFSMDTIATPIVGSRYDFWIILAIMLAATIGMFTFFKKKRWL